MRKMICSELWQLYHSNQIEESWMIIPILCLFLQETSPDNSKLSFTYFFLKYTNLPLLWLFLFKVYTSKQVVLTWRSIRKTGWGICLLWKCAAFENFFDTKNGRFSLINRMFLHFWYLEWVACQKHSHSKARLTHEGVQRSLFWLLKMLN